MSLRDHFIQMARNNAWSNLRLYRACRSLDHAALVAPRTSFFPTILSTLQHIWVVDAFYVDGLENGGRGASVWAEEGKHAEIESLWRAQRAIDARLLAYCEGANTETLGAQVALQRANGPRFDAAQDILAHLFVHQIHHRGQVHAMLSGTTIAPPQLDEWFLRLDRQRSERELATADAEP